MALLENTSVVNKGASYYTEKENTSSSFSVNALCDTFFERAGSVRETLQATRHLGRGNERWKAVGDMRRKVEEMGHLVRDMREILREESTTSVRVLLKKKIQAADIEWKDVKGEVEAHEAATKRLDLLTHIEGVKEGEGTGRQGDTRKRILATSGEVERQSERLHATGNMVAETEELGLGVINEMAGQRETILKMKEALSDTTSFMHQSSRLLRSLAASAWMSKAFLYTIIALLITLIMILVVI